MKKVNFSILLIGITVFVVSCSSDNTSTNKFCIYTATQECFSTSSDNCPAGGELSDFCPYSMQESSSSFGNKSSSSSVNGGSSQATTGGTVTEVETCEVKELDFLKIKYECEVESKDEIYYSCTENGLKEKIYTGSKWSENFEERYSINNKILDFDVGSYEDKYILRFTGNQDIIIGTWTRSKEPCEEIYFYDDGDYKSKYKCLPDYNITKMVVTNQNIIITRDFCITDHVEDGGVSEGWKIKVIDCNNFEYSKGTAKISVYWNTEQGYARVSYNGKNCYHQEPSYSDSESACQAANEKYQIVLASIPSNCHTYYSYHRTKYYYDFIKEIFPKCLEENSFPEETLSLRHLLMSGSDDYDSPAIPDECKGWVD